MAAIAVNVALLGVIVKRRIDGRRKRKVWIKNWLQRRPNNNVLHMLSKELLEEDPMSYRNFLRLTNSQFLYILSLVTKDIAKQETFMRDSISAQNSILLLAMCDARYKFTYINVGANGRVSDAGVFQQSSLCRAMQAVHNSLNFPKPQPLPGQNSEVPYVIIGDDAFPLGKHLL
ncbi:hypothetical protein ILUMI_17392 [Ignelater luminosus]|uniref:DDE Tnp4 domain-containing protein n=1 Tax=Ignelater luminosus TaxID=2038154 RepID=A0A8K0G7K9_IGNLU|nr:hypothetical protein ILUMI_17392 [Ignelater luminosus]